MGDSPHLVGGQSNINKGSTFGRKEDTGGIILEDYPARFISNELSQTRHDCVIEITRHRQKFW